MGAKHVKGLHENMAGLSDDETAVVALIVERLLMGQRRYGILHLQSDKRNFQHEALEEALDLAIYVAGGLLQRKYDTTATTQPRPYIARLRGRRKLATRLSVSWWRWPIILSELGRWWNRCVMRLCRVHGEWDEASG